MYSRDLQLLALHHYTKLGSLRKTAKVMLISHMTVKRWLIDIERKQRKKQNTKSLNIQEIVLSLVKNDPHITLKQIQCLILDEIALSVSKELIRLVLKKNNISRKKIRYYGECKDLQLKTQTFISQRDKYKLRNKKFVSIDETSFGRHGKVVYGYSQKGRRIFKRKSYAHVSTQSALCCLHQDGEICYRLQKGGINAETFYEFLTSLHLEPSTVVLLDNCRIHHTRLIKEYAEMLDIHLLYTPPYSPWFNPIEFSFSNIKRHYYKNEKIESAFSNQSNETNKRIFEKTLKCVHRN